MRALLALSFYDPAFLPATPLATGTAKRLTTLSASSAIDAARSCGARAVAWVGGGLAVQLLCRFARLEHLGRDAPHRLHLRDMASVRQGTVGGGVR